MLSAARDVGTQTGSSLLEALFAMAIFSFGLLGLAGALANAMRATDEARLRDDAANLAHTAIGEMWATSAATLDARFGPDQPARLDWQRRAASRLPAATAAIDIVDASASDPGRSVLVTITWLRSGSGARHRYAISTNVGRNP